jgi:hypothetical protein
MKPTKAYRNTFITLVSNPSLQTADALSAGATVGTGVEPPV